MWRVTIRKSVQKYLNALQRPQRERIREIIDLFKASPFPAGYDIKPLEGRPEYRLKYSKWRIIYNVFKLEVSIVVVKIDSRGDVYKN